MNYWLIAVLRLLTLENLPEKKLFVNNVRWWLKLGLFYAKMRISSPKCWVVLVPIIVFMVGSWAEHRLTRAIRTNVHRGILTICSSFLVRRVIINNGALFVWRIRSRWLLAAHRSSIVTKGWHRTRDDLRISLLIAAASASLYIRDARIDRLLRDKLSCSLHTTST